MFKFEIDENMPTRYLQGKYSFLAQLNSKRYTEKRKTDLSIVSLKLPFDMNKFNFTKINQNEVNLMSQFVFFNGSLFSFFFCLDYFSNFLSFSVKKLNFVTQSTIAGFELIQHELTC